jgi:hypothetical protein
LRFKIRAGVVRPGARVVGILLCCTWGVGVSLFWILWSFLYLVACAALGLWFLLWPFLDLLVVY